MNEIVNEVVKKIIHMPSDFNNSNKSEYTLLQESGYFELHNQVNENDIMEILKKFPHLINEWLQWSDDKRSTPTWYFRKGDDGKCYVGHWPEDNEFKEINSPDEFYSCAAFIKKDIESARINYNMLSR